MGKRRNKRWGRRTVYDCGCCETIPKADTDPTNRARRDRFWWKQELAGEGEGIFEEYAYYGKWEN